MRILHILLSLLPWSSLALSITGSNEDPTMEHFMGWGRNGSLLVSSVRASPSAPVVWNGQCVVDSGKRVLPYYGGKTNNRTPQNCIALCHGKNYKFAGVQHRDECWCGNTAPKSTTSAAECNRPCPGDSSKTCGASWRMNVYSSTGDDAYCGRYRGHPHESIYLVRHRPAPKCQADNPLVFEPRFYLAKYVDLQCAYIKPGYDTYSKASDHWCRYGAREGRQGVGSFNSKQYLARHADLRRAFGSDTKKAVEHFIRFGFKEGRKGN